MIKTKNIWKRTPRKFRLPILGLGIAALALALYTFAGSPTLTLEQEYRRAEKAHLVGPARILGTVELETDFLSYWDMLIADDGDGIIFFCYNYPDFAELDQTELIYRKKTGDITVLSAPFPNESREHTTVAKLPVFIFDEYPEAVRAELDLTLNTTYDGKNFQKHYTLKSRREVSGYFQFTLGSVNPEGLGAEGYAIQVFTLISGYGGRSMDDYSIPAEVRLYDADNQLICEKTLEITSVVEQAHNSQED